MSALRPASHIPGDMVVIRDQFQTSSTIVSALPSAPVMNTSTPLITTTTAVSVLPKEINLPVPFTSQAPEKNWDQPWQDACEEAAILMMDGYYKGYNVSPLFAKDEIIKMVAWEEEKGWGRSIEIEKIATLFESYLRYKETGRKVRIIENPTVGQIKKYLANKTPVYVVADGKTLPNPHFRNGGPAYHALVIRGYTETEFITNDPGTQFGKNFSYAYDDLMNSIRDWNGGAVKTGRRVILVIE
ncbi:MAG TPA: C39 family peptidase [Candidatus Kapabacteria bacterium]|nr:C39 family peptidase [Candidatus Kapabacteria bacterium]